MIDMVSLEKSGSRIVSSMRCDVFDDPFDDATDDFDGRVTTNSMPSGSATPSSPQASSTGMPLMASSAARSVGEHGANTDDGPMRISGGAS